MKDSHYEDAVNGSLSFLWLELTNRCNLQCVHCYANSSPFEPLSHGMDHANWINTIDEAYLRGCRQIQFIGGEPLLYPRLNELIRHSNQRGYSFIEVFSNGTKLTEEHVESFYKYNVSLATSYYSYKSEVHDSITNLKGSWSKTTAAIKLAQKIEVPLRVGIIEMAENKESVKDTVKYLRDLGIQDVGIDKLRGPRRTEARLADRSALDHLCGSCWNGKLTIDSEGNMFPCPFSRFVKVGNISSGLDLALNSIELKQFRETIYNHKLSTFMPQGDQPGECGPNECYPISCLPKCRPECSPSECKPQGGCMPD